ncbi:MAG: transposase [Gloeocapsa sp. DLM2.Bin57]|nr:MAG: transposase [Gloeocapsa sp. DLM2.Bin57]
MFVLEFKARTPKPAQINSINEAIRTLQFVRNKVLRYWIDSKDNGKASLFRYNTALRKEYPFVEHLNSTACQVAVERVLIAVNKFFDNCKKKIKGRKGYPKFQKNNRSVEYKQSGWKLSEDKKKITFTDKKGIGTIILIGSRDLNYYQPEQIKRVRIIKRSDGYYIQFCINLDPRDTVKQLEPTKKTVGLDMGLKYFYADSNGEIVENPRFYREAEKRLKRLNRQKSKKFRQGKKQSHNYLKARNRYARKHLKVSRQREEFVKRVALRVVQSSDLIAYEDLKVKNMVKSKLAKSINDVAWTTFKRWLDYFGYKYGKATIAVPPHNTSQDCSNCGKKVQKSLSTRTHKCPHCGYEADRDVNAAINILKKGLSTLGRREAFKAWGDDTATLIEAILSEQVASMNQESPHF